MYMMDEGLFSGAIFEGFQSVPLCVWLLFVSLGCSASWWAGQPVPATRGHARFRGRRAFVAGH